MEIVFDKYGSLYILGNRRDSCIPLNDWKTCLWKFNPGETIWLDPYNSNSLTPGGIEGIGRELYISGDGSIYFWIMDYYGLPQFIIERPFGININFIYPLYGSWYYTDMAVDCHNKIYLAKGEFLYGFDYPSFQNQILVPYRRNFIYDVKLNNYGEVFILFFNSIHIVMSYELPEGWYTCSLCKYPGEENFSLRAKSPNCGVQKEGEILLKLDRNPETQNDEIIVLNSNSKSANILFAEKPKISAYWKDKNGKEEEIQVKWELTSTNISSDPTSISDSSLFRNSPVLLFTNNQNPYNSKVLEFQTVHTGNIKIRTTYELEGNKSELEIEINIDKPSRLGNFSNNYDEKIIEYAHKYGIPPQYLKGQVEKEAIKIGGNYRADSFRYELIGWDYGTSLWHGIGIYQWNEITWEDYRTSYSCFHYPDGSNLSQAVLNKINQYYKIIDMKTDISNPYICDTYSNLSTYATLVDVYNANNGWGDGSYPYVFYNGREGPCNRREGWDRYAFGRGNWVAYDFGVYYCNFYDIQNVCCTSSQQRFIDFLYNNPNYYAQIPIGSSYGLLQIMYINATYLYEWKRDEPACNREPSLLFDVDVNLDLGARFDARQMNDERIQSSRNFGEYRERLKLGFGRYNDPQNGNEAYGEDVLNNSENFMPIN